MTKALGYSMFGLYVLFVIQDLLRNPELNWWPAFQVINFQISMKELNVNEMNETGDPCKYNIYIYS